MSALEATKSPEPTPEVAEDPRTRGRTFIADEVVSVRFGRKLFTAASEPKTALWLPSAMHNDLYEFGAAEAVIEFLSGLTEN